MAELPWIHPSAARPSYLKTRRFPYPPHERFGFIGIKFFGIILLWEALKSWMRLTLSVRILSCMK